MENKEQGFDIQKDLEIDPLALDAMVVDQPSKLFFYSDMLNDAKFTLANLDLQLSVKTSDVSLAIRKGEYPEAKDMKITENFVKELLEADSELNKLRREVILQKDVVNKLSSAVEAFQHRKYSLIKAVDLWIAGYYGEVSQKKTRNGREITGEVDTRIDDSFVSSLKEE